MCWWHIQSRTSEPCLAFTAAIWSFSLIIVILEAVNSQNSSEWNLSARLSWIVSYSANEPWTHYFLQLLSDFKMLTDVGILRLGALFLESPGTAHFSCAAPPCSASDIPDIPCPGAARPIHGTFACEPFAGFPHAGLLQCFQIPVTWLLHLRICWCACPVCHWDPLRCTHWIPGNTLLCGI